jgi:hypothetical protein
MQPQNPIEIRADLLRRTVLGMTNEECAEALPWLRHWLGAREAEVAPRTEATPLRRGTDVLGREIVSVVVDGYDLIRMVRVMDVARTPPSLRNGTGQNMFDALESVPLKRDEIRMIIAHVRQTRSRYQGEYESAFVPGERRLLRAHPGTRKGWVAISMLAIPAVQVAGDDDELLIAQG